MNHFNGLTALITGANRGIGLELARQLHHAGARVIAVYRQAECAALDALGITQITQIDVCSETLSNQLQEGLKHHKIEQIDVLINNAGLLIADQLGSIDYQGFMKQIEVNTSGPLRVTEALVPYLSRTARVACISSRMGSIEDNTSGAYYGYRASKAALNAVVKSLALDLASQGSTVIALHPGFVKTGMTGGRGLIDADEAARGLLEQIERMNKATTGTFWHMNGEQLPW